MTEGKPLHGCEVEKPTISEREYTQAMGWLSAELAIRADAWNGNAPDWFPEPPEWMDLAEQALAEARRPLEEWEQEHARDVGRKLGLLPAEGESHA